MHYSVHKALNKKNGTFLAVLFSFFVNVIHAGTMEEVLDILHQPNQAVKVQQVDRARLRVLEFSSNQITDIDITSGQPAPFGTLEFTLKACHHNYQKRAGQDIARVKVVQKNQQGQGSIIFDNWLFKLFPNVTTLDHPLYDIRLLTCLSPSHVPEVQELESGTLQEEDLLP